jgi:hypothetical protein
MQIYIGDGEYAESPGEDAEEAYDNWLFHIARESDAPEDTDDEYVNETTDDIPIEEFDPNWDDDEDWEDD